MPPEFAVTSRRNSSPGPAFQLPGQGNHRAEESALTKCHVERSGSPVALGRSVPTTYGVVSVYYFILG